MGTRHPGTERRAEGRGGKARGAGSDPGRHRHGQVLGDEDAGGAEGRRWRRAAGDESRAAPPRREWPGPRGRRGLGRSGWGGRGRRGSGGLCAHTSASALHMGCDGEIDDLNR